jgi:hypothetical protein
MKTIFFRKNSNYFFKLVSARARAMAARLLLLLRVQTKKKR